MIFIDTGAFLARFLAQDQFHARAESSWRRLESIPGNCFTSNFVLDELFTLLARRADYAFAAERARLLYSSRLLEILRPSSEDELRAVDFFEKFADQSVSFTDCISFALLKREKIKKVFTFDRHFQHAGFQVWP